MGFVSDTSASAWRTAYVSAVFENKPVRLVLRIAEARAAITERLNSRVEIGTHEHESIEAARQELMNLKAHHVEVAPSVPTGGDTRP
jgi:hypothetical protein